MSLLTPGGLPEEDRLGNPIYASFRNMIRLESITNDGELSGHVKARLMLELLYGPGGIPEDVEAALRELTWFYYCGNEPEEAQGKGGRGTIARLYDFEEDAGIIYAGFLYAYGINLADEDAWLHWWEFMALFIGLPEDTKMAQRIYYRGLDTSGMKGESKKHAEEMKRAVALKSHRKAAGMSLAQIEKLNRENVDRKFAEAERLLREREAKEAEGQTPMGE